jgi:hypothetical protein
MKRTLLLLLVFLYVHVSGQTVYTLGTGTTTNATGGYPAPYNNYWGFAKHQFLVKASELTAAGASAGVIFNLGFNVLGVNSNYNTLAGYTIKIKHVPVATTTLNATFDNTGLTTVFGPVAYTPVLGWNTHAFSNCFSWDGTSNLLIDICYTSGTASTNGARTYWTTGLSFTASRHTYNGNCNTTSATTSTSRPNMRMAIGTLKPDISITGFVSPSNYIVDFNVKMPVTIKVKNSGCAAIDSAMVGYTWKGRAPVYDTLKFSPPLAPGASVNHTFTDSITTDSVGIGILKAWANYPNNVFPDFNPVNDSASYLVYVNENTAYDSMGYNGKNFWVAFMQNFDNHGAQLSLNISATKQAKVTITVPRIQAAPLYTNAVIPANTIVPFNIPLNIGIPPTMMATDQNSRETIGKTGINIVSDENISVYGMNEISGGSTDGFLAIPNGGLGTQYTILTPKGIYNPAGAGGTGVPNSPAEFIVVATQDNTNVTINAKRPTSGHAANVPWTVTLNKGQTYLVWGKITPNEVAPTSSEDLTGTTITATKPVAVFSGSGCSNVPFVDDPGECSYCNHLVEAIAPSTTFGKHYFLCDFAVKTASDYVRIMATTAGPTNVTTSTGLTFALTGAGAFRDIDLANNSAMEINSDNPIYVVQISRGGACDGTVSDPMMISMIAEEQWGKYYPFITPAVSFVNNNWINIVKKGASNVIAVDGVVIPQASFTRIGTTNYYYVRYKVGVGAHLVVGSDFFIPYVYGFDNDDAYGYPASGASLHPIPLAVPVTLASFTGKLEKGKSLLSWLTATEKNNSHFIIERSHDGQLFTEAGRVPGSGNSQVVRNYSFTDTRPGTGDIYYRLRQVDYDGKFSYSNIVLLSNLSSPAGVFRFNSVSPNPATDNVQVNFTSNSEEPAECTVYDLLGRRQLQVTLDGITAGVNEKELNLSRLEKGTYFIVISKGEEKIQSRIVKQ